MQTSILRKGRCIICLFTLLTLITSCGNAVKKNSAVREVTDMAGRKMMVPDTIKRIYVDCAGGLTLYAVAPDMIVARTVWINDNIKPFLQKKYADLPYTNGSAEEIMRLKPDIIISSFAINKKTSDDADRLAKQTGIPVFQVEMDMNLYPKIFRSLGNLLRRENQTKQMEAFVHTYLDSIKIRAAKIPDNRKIRVYYAEGSNGLATDPSGSFHSQVIDFVGAKNVSQVAIFSKKGMSPVSMEQVLKWNPDVVLCWTGDKGTYKSVTQNDVWKKVSALKNNAVYQIPYLPFGWFDRPPGTNRIIGTIWTAHLLYPDIFPYDMPKVTQEYFKIFYHRKLTQQELNEVLHPNPKGMAGPGIMKHKMLEGKFHQ